MELVNLTHKIVITTVNVEAINIVMQQTYFHALLIIAVFANILQVHMVLQIAIMLLNALKVMNVKLQ